MWTPDEEDDTSERCLYVSGRFDRLRKREKPRVNHVFRSLFIRELANGLAKPSEEDR